MLEPRKIRRDTVCAALKQAQHYRLLNEPALAESICRDIIAVDATHEEAWVTLLLSLTDQFDDKKSLAFDQANNALEQLSNEFKKHYYSGIIDERWARAQHKLGLPAESVESWIRSAMSSFTKAEELAPESDPNPLLRWNTCARFLIEASQLRQVFAVSDSLERDVYEEYGDDVPLR
ncbi:MAG: hypothetical protein SGI77_26500 [Pirellulaceae bacterium]|nr:hypothetical protein [Pirellulaceae bacterium]